MMEPSPTGPGTYPLWSDVMLDSRHVLLRLAQTEDREAVRDFVERRSEMARSYSFLGHAGSTAGCSRDTTALAADLAPATFVATVLEESGERIVGVSLYSWDKSGCQCECAVTVADSWQKRGLGTLLMSHLIELARGQGVHRMVGVDLANNPFLPDMAARLGFSRQILPAAPELVIHELVF